MEAAALIFGLSAHFADPEPSKDGVDQYEGFNPGLGLKVEHGHAFAAAGTFHNSIDRESRFVAIGANYHFNEEAGVLVGAALMTGYSDIPLVRPMLTVYREYGTVRLHAALLDRAVGVFLEVRL